MKKLILSIFSLIIAVSCIEDVDLGIEAPEQTLDILIIEATLTDEFKKQRIQISRMDTITDLEIDTLINPLLPVFNVDRDLVRYELNATVAVEDNLGSTFNFEEVSAGVYESIIPFGAEIGTSYQLKVTTSDGMEYSSNTSEIEGIATIDNLYAERIVNDRGVEGIGIYLDNTTGIGNVHNFRYTFDETYKIIAPFWDELAFKLTNYDPCALPVVTYDLEIVPRETEQRVCYGRQSSNTVIQAQQNNQQSRGLNRFMVRFIDRNNFILSHRYSMEVTQMVTGSESFGFYELLKNFSQTGNIFSQVQPGFLEGNIAAEDGSTGNIIGFFDVVSVSKKRMFFNYTDFYPDEALPEYPLTCFEQSSPESHASRCDPNAVSSRCPLSIIEGVNLELYTYVRNNDGLAVGGCPGPYVYVFKACGDCTALGSNEVPEFWTE